jgi:hypothetical protein
MPDRKDGSSHDWRNKPEEVGTHMNRLVMRACDLKAELGRINREIARWSRHLKSLMQERGPIMNRSVSKPAARRSNSGDRVPRL